MRKILIDLHLHTVACGHALQTIYDIVRKAKEDHLKIVGINEHGPLIDTKLYFFGPLTRLPRIMDGVEVWRGCECNPIKNGRVDLPGSFVERLDFLSLGVHDHYQPTKNQAEMTRIVKAIIKAYPKMRFITHPYNNEANFDIEDIAQFACDNNILMELNDNYFKERYLTPELMERAKLMVKICQENKMPFIINSDAHVLNDVGNFENVFKVWDELGLREKDIINYDEKKVREFFKI